MEKRSRRRTRDLVTQAASQGLSENEIGCARISMMARSTNAPCKGRIQMRKTNPLHFFTFGLQRTAGPYSWVKPGKTPTEQMSSALPPTTDIERPRRHVREVPNGGIPKAAYSLSHLLDNLVGAGDHRLRNCELLNFLPASRTDSGRSTLRNNQRRLGREFSVEKTKYRDVFLDHVLNK